MTDSTLEMAADIVSAFVSNNSVPVIDLPSVIASVHATLNELVTGQAPVQVDPPKEPAVPIKKSVTPDFIICLEDGKKFKSLKRHLRTSYGLTPDQYREKWKLPVDYPIVAANYAATRSALAKSIGLGQKRRKATVKGKK
jgi:predicted transcriptional regulator